MASCADTEEATARVGAAHPLSGRAPLLDVLVYLKLENRQRSGSYIVRGFYALMRRLSARIAISGIVIASLDNRAQGKVRLDSYKTQQRDFVERQ